MTKNTNAYKNEAIDILSDVHAGKIDQISIIVEIAKRHPKVLCDAQKTWMGDAKKILVSEGKVAAVKYVKAKTGCNLNEAVDRVDEL